MGIRFPCHVCNKRLNVKAFLAGKRGICPHCGTKVDIPWQSEGEASAADVDESYVPRSVSPGTASGPASGGGNGHSRSGSSGGFGPTTVPVSGRAGKASNSPGTIPVGGSSTPGGGAGGPSSPSGLSSRPSNDESQSPLAGPPSTGPSTSSPEPPPVSGPTDPIDEAPDAVWYVRPPTGGQFGPASGEIMRRWINEGRVSGDSLVWREGWSDWKTAETLFSNLAGGNTSVSQPQPAAPGGTGLSPGPAPLGAAPIGKDAAGAGASRAYGRRRNNNALAIGMVVVLSLASLALLGVLIAVTMSS